jgi:alkylated DNA repair dioxygenase AlkB
MGKQSDLFESGKPLPEGLRYQAELISPAEQDALVSRVETLPFRAFEFKGYLGRRRTVSFGWKYDFERERIEASEPMPSFLLELRKRAAQFAGMAPADLQQVLVTEYDAGAGIGWHKDKRVFGEVVGISLLSACTFRLRRKAGEKWERASFTAEPGSAYLLKGPSRTEWEHSIPAVEALRYSITFRNVNGGAAAS